MTDAALVLPELILAFSGLVLLLLAAFGGQKSAPFVAGGAVVALILAAALAPGRAGVAFGGMFVADGFGLFVKETVLAASALALLLGISEKQGAERMRETLATTGISEEINYKTEAPILILFAALGMMLMVSARDLIALYVGLELQNLALYVLTALRRDEARAGEAGLKYVALGAVSSAILLFGLSLLYGAAGGTGYEVLAQKLGSGLTPGLAVGLAFAVAGLAFKVAAVPFHMWSPDVYEGAPMPVTAFLAAAPKLAALALLTRLLAGPFAEAASFWQPAVAVLAAASMTLGGFAGLGQTNLKRLMAYSGILNIGTAMVGLAAFAPGPARTAGIEGLLLYLALYAPGVLAVFGVLLALRRRGAPVEALDDLAGLAKTRPALALAMGAALFSLAGIPPFAGFFGKYVVLLAAVKGEQTWLALWGVVMSVVAAGYYLRIVKVMYFDAPRAAPVEVAENRSVHFVVVLAAIAVTFFVLFPSPLMEAARNVAESFTRL